MVASPQSPLPFRPARSLLLLHSPSIAIRVARQSPATQKSICGSQRREGCRKLLTRKAARLKEGLEPSSRNYIVIGAGTLDCAYRVAIPLPRSFRPKRLHSEANETDPFSVRPSSVCNVLSPSLLTCLHDFVQVRRWPNLENAAVLQGRMLRHELYSVIHVPRLKDENAAELFLGFRIRTIRSCDFAVLPIQGQGGFPRLSASPPAQCPLARNGRRIQSMCRTSPVARPRSCLRVCLCRSIPSKCISSLFSCWWGTSKGVADFSVTVSNNKAQHILI